VEGVPTKVVGPAAHKYDYSFAENSEKNAKACNLDRQCHKLIKVPCFVMEKRPAVK